MHTKRPGDRVELGELEGSLGIEDLDRDVAFLATGAGVTPMIAMVRQYLQEGSGDATLLFGESEEASIIHRGTFDHLAATRPNFEAAFALSDPNWE